MVEAEAAAGHGGAEAQPSRGAARGGSEHGREVRVVVPPTNSVLLFPWEWRTCARPQ